MMPRTGRLEVEDEDIKAHILILPFLWRLLARPRPQTAAYSDCPRAGGTAFRARG